MLKGVVYGAWYGLGGWLKRCRDGKYAVNPWRCDVWVVCAYALSLVSLVVGEVFCGGSASLHDWYVHVLESAFCNLFWGVFWGNDGMKRYGELMLLFVGLVWLNCILYVFSV